MRKLSFIVLILMGMLIQPSLLAAMPSQGIRITDQCDQLARVFDAQNIVAGRQLAETLVTQLRQGIVPHYVAVGPDRYRPLPAIFAQLARSTPADGVLTSADELRVLPHTVQGKRLMLVTDSAAPLTPARARQVVAVARAGKIVIDLLWLGDPADAQAAFLGDLSAATGGVGLQLPKNLCQLNRS